MNNVLVSIIVPVYNVEKYLARCIDSILSQTYQNFELILVNDGSQDESGIICDQYSQKDNRIKVIHKPNGGVASARNTGLDMAIGKYVMFIDSDDWINPNHIAQLLPIENEDFIYGGYKQYDHGVFVALKVPPASFLTIEEVKSEFFSLLRQYLFYYVWCCCYSSEIINKNRIRFDTETKIGEDMLFNIQYLKNCNLVRLTDSTCYCHDGVDNSLVRRYYANRMEKERTETQTQEEFAGQKCYSMRWFNWHTAINHYIVWAKRKSGKDHNGVRKRLVKCFRDPYFRECIPYMRKHGTLDEKIKTFFMYNWLYPLYDPTYSFVLSIRRIRNKIIGRKG